MEYLKDKAVGIITAFNDSYTNKENLYRNRQLEGVCRLSGFGFSHIDGFVNGERERGIILNAAMDARHRLRDFLIDNREKFEQDAVFYYDCHTKEGTILSVSGELSCDWDQDKIAEIYSKVRNKPFVFEGLRSPDSLMTLAYRKRFPNYKEEWE